MTAFVIVEMDDQDGWLVGPFDTEEEAKAWVSEVRSTVEKFHGWDYYPHDPVVPLPPDKARERIEKALEDTQ